MSSQKIILQLNSKIKDKSISSTNMNQDLMMPEFDLINTKDLINDRSKLLTPPNVKLLVNFYSRN